MSSFWQRPSQRGLELGRVEGSGNLGHARSMCLSRLGGKEAQMSSSCWAGILHSLLTDTSQDGMSLIGSRGRPLLVTRSANMFPSRKEEQDRQVQTNDQKQTSVSKALCPGHSWQELAASRSQVQALTHLHGKEQASQARLLAP